MHLCVPSQIDITMNMQKLLNQDQRQQRHSMNPERLETCENDLSTNLDTEVVEAFSLSNDHDADQSVENVANDGDPSSAFNNKTFPEIVSSFYTLGDPSFVLLTCVTHT
jgi:hypothetical protein